MKRQTYVRSCVHNRYFDLPAVTSQGLFVFTEPVTGEISKGVKFQKESGQECSLTLGSLPLEQFRFSEPDPFFQILLLLARRMYIKFLFNSRLPAVWPPCSIAMT